MEENFEKKQDKDPFSDTFVTLKEFTNRLEELTEVYIHNTEILGADKKGTIRSACGSDGEFYILFEKSDGQVKFIKTVSTFAEAKTIAPSFVDSMCK